MPRTITQKVVFKNIPVATLYNIYLDSKEHSASTGASVKIQKKEGSKFSAHDNYITGKNLELAKDKLIVQSWRAVDWNKSDPDSTFIFLFEKNGSHGIINMVHANVPDRKYENLKKSWNDYYWKSWKVYFAHRPVRGLHKKK